MIGSESWRVDRSDRSVFAVRTPELHWIAQIYKFIDAHLCVTNSKGGLNFDKQQRVEQSVDVCKLSPEKAVSLCLRLIGRNLFQLQIIKNPDILQW